MAINPDDPDSNLNIGGYEQQQRDFSQAIVQYRKVIAATQESMVVNTVVRAKAYNNMGYAYRALGDLPRHARASKKPCAWIRGTAKAWLGLGLIEQKSGDLKSAIRAYTQIIKLQPSDWSYLLLARALEQSGDNQAARSAIEQARSMSRDLEKAQRGADQLLAQ